MNIRLRGRRGVQVPSHQTVLKGNELVLNQSLGHDVCKLLGGLNLLDVDLTSRVAFSLDVLLEEVELDGKELASRSDARKGNLCCPLPLSVRMSATRSCDQLLEQLCVAWGFSQLSLEQLSVVPDVFKV